MATIEHRGDYQYRVRIRRKGISVTRAFESYVAAEHWALRMDGKAAGRELSDDREARETTLQEVIGWYLDRIAPVDPATGKRRRRSQNIKNKVGPDADCSAQTVLHRLNLLSDLYNTWNITHAFQIANPVTRKVRPPVANERKRRLFTIFKGGGRRGEEAF